MINGFRCSVCIMVGNMRINYTKENVLSKTFVLLSTTALYSYKGLSQ